MTQSVHYRLKLKYCIVYIITAKVTPRTMIVCLSIDLKAYITSYSPANRTGSPQVLVLVIYKTCTLHKHKPYKHNPKVSPFGIALINNGQ